MQNTFEDYQKRTLNLTITTTEAAAAEEEITIRDFDSYYVILDLYCHYGNQIITIIRPQPPINILNPTKKGLAPEEACNSPTNTTTHNLPCKSPNQICQAIWIRMRNTPSDDG